MFRPRELLRKDMSSIQEAIQKAVESFDSSMQKEFYAHVLLAGGNTMYRGMGDRIQAELSGLAPKDMTVKVVASNERHYSAWIGGSLWAAASDSSQFVSKQEYDETGAILFYRKWFIYI